LGVGYGPTGLYGGLAILLVRNLGSQGINRNALRILRDFVNLASILRKSY